MYWGVQAKDQIWAEFDPDFAGSLNFNWPPYDTMKLLTGKFYLIGLTLPDMFISSRQVACESIISKLYSAEQMIHDRLDSLKLGFLKPMFPLWISAQTYQNVQTRITFNGPMPNDNFLAVWKMADYARKQDWSHYEKSLIYGALAHCMQDAYGLAYIPSRYGYGFAIDAPEALDYPMLRYAEMYDELFTGTHITNWNFVRHLFGSIGVSGSQVLWKHDVMQFYSRMTAQPTYQGWQQLDFLPIQRFVEAANAIGYGTPSLTHNRLRSYLHGWGIGMFMLYGYAYDTTGITGDIGGIYAHPDWSPARITQFWGQIGTDQWTLSRFESILRTLELFRRFPIIGKPIDKLLRGVEAILHEFDELVELDLPWPVYFETGQHFEMFFAVLPESLRQDHQEEYNDALANLTMWEDNAEVLEPQKRLSYSDEVSASIELMGPGLGSWTMNEGPIDLEVSGVAVWPTARKAGLTAGMFHPGDTGYYRPPGVLGLGFQQDGKWVWSDITVGRYGDPVYVDLAYDLMTFGWTRLRVLGKNVGGNRVELVSSPADRQGVTRWKGSHQYDLQQAVNNQDAREISFKVQTRQVSGSNYKDMLDSDYRDAYWSHPGIYDNQLYQSLLTGGNPIRTPGQNPFVNPREFWPYAVSLDVVDWYLSTPTGLKAQVATGGQQLGITLEWLNNSAYALEYQIKKSYASVDTMILVQPAPGGQVIWTDYDVQPGEIYSYKVRVKRDTWTSDWSNEAQSAIAYSDMAPVTAYNNANKIAVSGDTIHVTYFGQTPAAPTTWEQVLYISSTDGGQTWGPLEVVSSGQVGGFFPSIALGPEGEPYVLWASEWRWLGRGGDTLPLGGDSIPDHKKEWRILYEVSSRDTNGTWWKRPVAGIVGSDVFEEKAEDFQPPQASFVIQGDSGYFAFAVGEHDSVVTEPGIWHSAFKLDEQVADLPSGTRLNDAWDAKMSPSLLVDDYGRQIISYTARDTVKLWYRVPGQSFALVESFFDMGEVQSLTAGLGRSGYLHLAWTSGMSGDTLKSRFYYRSLLNNHVIIGHPEVVDPDAYNHNGGVHPKFAAGRFGLPVILYESQNDEPPDWGIRYAVQVVPGFWIRKDLFSDWYTDPFHPQGYVVGNRLIAYWSARYPSSSVYYLKTAETTIPPIITTPINAVVDDITGPNTGRKLSVDPWWGGVHIVTGDGENIHYARANHETIEELLVLDQGTNPALVTFGTPAVSYLRDDTVFVRWVGPDSNWYAGVVFAGSDTNRPGPPALALGFDTSAYYGSYLALAFPVYFPAEDRSQIWYARCDVDEYANETVALTLISDTTGLITDSLVSLAITPYGPSHVAWQRGEEIWYWTGGPDTTPADGGIPGGEYELSDSRPGTPVDGRLVSTRSPVSGSPGAIGSKGGFSTGRFVTGPVSAGPNPAVGKPAIGRRGDSAIPDEAILSDTALSPFSGRHPFLLAHGDQILLLRERQPSRMLSLMVRNTWDPPDLWGGINLNIPVRHAAVDYGAIVACDTTVDSSAVWVTDGLDMLYMTDYPNDHQTAWPHVGVLYSYDSIIGVYADSVYALWTAAVDDSLYAPRVNMQSVAQATLDKGWRKPEPSHTLIGGQQRPSFYTRHRTGRRSSRNIAFDYGTDSLSYELTYLDPRYNYLAEMVFIQDRGRPVEQMLESRGRELARIRVGTEEPETLRVVLPDWFREGASHRFSVRGLLGEQAMLAELKLYQFTRREAPNRGGAMGGPGAGRQLPRLYPPQPNPFNRTTAIRYQLPRPGRACLRVYDVTGRLVRTLQDGEQAAGTHQVTWDGADNRGRQVANGVYFYRLDALDSNDTKQLVLMR